MLALTGTIVRKRHNGGGGVTPLRPRSRKAVAVMRSNAQTVASLVDKDIIKNPPNDIYIINFNIYKTHRLEHLPRGRRVGRWASGHLLTRSTPCCIPRRIPRLNGHCQVRTGCRPPGTLKIITPVTSCLLYTSPSPRD